MSLARKIERARKPSKKELAKQVEEAIAEQVDAHKEEYLADFLLLMLAWLRCERGYGKKRLKETLIDFVEFMRVNGGRVYREEVAAMLKEETGFDILELAKEKAKSRGDNISSNR